MVNSVTRNGHRDWHSRNWRNERNVRNAGGKDGSQAETKTDD